MPETIKGTCTQSTRSKWHSKPDKKQGKTQKFANKILLDAVKCHRPRWSPDHPYAIAPGVCVCVAPLENCSALIIRCSFLWTQLVLGLRLYDANCNWIFRYNLHSNGWRLLALATSYTPLRSTAEITVCSHTIYAVCPAIAMAGEHGSSCSMHWTKKNNTQLKSKEYEAR